MPVVAQVFCVVFGLECLGLLFMARDAFSVYVTPPRIDWAAFRRDVARRIAPPVR